MKPVQLTLLTDDLPHKKTFDAWRQTKGGGMILEHIFKVAANYARRYLNTKRRVSPWLVWALTRDHLVELKRRCQARGIVIKKVDGYTMGNCMLPHVSRFITERRPEWQGMFEQREVGRQLKGRKLLIDLKPERQRQSA